MSKVAVKVEKTKETKKFNKSFTTYAVEKAYKGQSEVVIQTKVLSDFVGKDGETVIGALTDISKWLRMGVITGFEVVTKENNLFEITLKDFDPEAQFAWTDKQTGEVKVWTPFRNLIAIKKAVEELTAEKEEELKKASA